MSKCTKKEIHDNSLDMFCVNGKICNTMTGRCVNIEGTSGRTIERMRKPQAIGMILAEKPRVIIQREKPKSPIAKSRVTLGPAPKLEKLKLLDKSKRTEVQTLLRGAMNHAEQVDSSLENKLNAYDAALRIARTFGDKKNIDIILRTIKKLNEQAKKNIAQFQNMAESDMKLGVALDRVDIETRMDKIKNKIRQLHELKIDSLKRKATDDFIHQIDTLIRGEDIEYEKLLEKRIINLKKGGSMKSPRRRSPMRRSPRRRSPMRRSPMRRSPRRRSPMRRSPMRRSPMRRRN